MSNNKTEKKPLTIEEIKKEIAEPEHDYLEKFATISDDKKSLLIRIPQEVRSHFGLKKGDKIRFYAEFREGKTPELNISLVKQNA